MLGQHIPGEMYKNILYFNVYLAISLEDPLLLSPQCNATLTLTLPHLPDDGSKDGFDGLSH